MKNVIVLLALVLLTFHANANEDGAYLDPAYDNLIHPKVDDAHMYKSGLTKNNVQAVIENMTPVRSQVSRGTCSIFSAVAMLEGMLVMKKGLEVGLDLSEEYLEYMAVGGRTSDGSNSYTNFSKIREYGVPFETTLPYIGQSWVDTPFLGQAQEKCGHLQGTKQKACLLVHHDTDLKKYLEKNSWDNTFNPDYVSERDPELYDAYIEGMELKEDHYPNIGSNFSVYNTTSVKSLLRQGIPLTMGHDFFYGAYNHRKATEYGINRDLTNWNKGIIGYPEYGSVDRVESRKHRAGHSVLVVGYDDDRVVTTSVKMNDGTIKEFTYKGVYYFKNSWGTSSFGSEMEIDGVRYPGYGMMTQKYAHEFGSFYQLPIK